MYKLLKIIRQPRALDALIQRLLKNDFKANVRRMQRMPNKMVNVLSQTRIANKRSTSAKPLPTKGERELVEFLGEEIVRERKAQVHKDPRCIIDGFNMVFDGADVQLIKELDKEKLLISFNINHTVVTESDFDSTQKPELCQLRSKPSFEVNILRGDNVLSFVCTFVNNSVVHEKDRKNEGFRIDEICIFNKTWNDRVYAVEGTLVDGYLYDLLVNMLIEKGITHEFAQKLSELATAHEHCSYINFLENLIKFTVTEK